MITRCAFTVPSVSEISLAFANVDEFPPKSLSLIKVSPTYKPTVTLLASLTVYPSLVLTLNLNEICRAPPPLRYSTVLFAVAVALFIGASFTSTLAISCFSRSAIVDQMPESIKLQ